MVESSIIAACRAPDSYQGMPSGMPQWLGYECAFRRLECSCSFMFLESGDRHDDHLPKSNDGAKQQPHQIEPLGMQPVIRQLAAKEPQQDRCWNNESHLGIASEGNERVLCGRLRHAGIVIQLRMGVRRSRRLGTSRPPDMGLLESKTWRPAGARSLRNKDLQ